MQLIERICVYVVFAYYDDVIRIDEKKIQMFSNSFWSDAYFDNQRKKLAGIYVNNVISQFNETGKNGMR